MKYYRHFRFFFDGLVLYSLDVVDPEHMFSTLSLSSALSAQALSNHLSSKRVYLGSYTLQRNQLTVTVALPYAIMTFELLLLDGDDGFQGKHNMLVLQSHSAVLVRDGQVVHYPIPVMNQFRYYRCWEMHAQAPEMLYALRQEMVSGVQTVTPNA